MVDRRELISVLRQIGIMMAAGVDFLRITAVLRAQTEDPRLLRMYDALDHDLTMGVSLADAMARQPDIFSPFAVSLVRQIEMRNEMAEMAQELSAAFHKIADYLQQDAALTRESGRAPSSSGSQRQTPVQRNDAAANSTLSNADVDRILSGVHQAVRRGLTALAALSGAIAVVYLAASLGLLAAHWLPVVVWSVAALGLGAAAWWVSAADAPAPAASQLPMTRDGDDGELVAAPELPVAGSGADADGTETGTTNLSGVTNAAGAGDEPPTPARNWADMHGMSDSEPDVLAPVRTIARPAWPVNGRHAEADAAAALTGAPDAAARGEADYE